MLLINEFKRPTSQVTSTGSPPQAPAQPATGGAQVPIYQSITVDPPGVTPDSTIIVLHGLDSRPEDLLIISTISRTWLPRTRFLFPRAPVADVTYYGKRAASWFNVFERKPGREDEQELRAAAAGIARLVREEKRLRNIPSERVIVLGMSQGGAVALTLYLAEEIKVGGVIGAATWLPIPTKWNKSNLAAANAGTNLLMQHGDRDDVIPVQEAIDSMRKVRSLGRNVRFIRYPRGGHTLAEEITKVAMDIIAFVKIQLGKV